MAMSSNNECRSAIGKAGAIPALVNKLTLDGVEGETPAQVRVLLALTNVLSVPTNCDMAVDSGLLMRFIELTHSNDVLLLNFLLIAMSTVLKCERHMKCFVDCGLVQKLLILIGRYAIDTEAGRQPGVPLIRIMLGRMMRCVCVWVCACVSSPPLGDPAGGRAYRGKDECTIFPFPFSPSCSLP